MKKLDKSLQEELLKTIQPTFDKFLSELSNIEARKLKEEETAKEQSLRLAEIIKETQENDAINKNLFNKKLGEVKDKQFEVDNAYKNLNDEIGKQSTLNKEIQATLTKMKSDEKETERIKNETSYRLEKKIKIAADYKKKLELLQTDTNKLDTRDKTLTDREKKVDQREATITKQEEEYATKKYELAQREAKVRTDEQRLKADWARRQNEKYDKKYGEK